MQVRVIDPQFGRWPQNNNNNNDNNNERLNNLLNIVTAYYHLVDSLELELKCGTQYLKH